MNGPLMLDISSSMGRIEDLPADLLSHLAIHHLDWTDIEQFGQTARRYRRALSLDEWLWQELYRRDLTSAKDEEGRYRRTSDCYRRDYVQFKSHREDFLHATRKGYEKPLTEFPSSCHSAITREAVRTGHADIAGAYASNCLGGDLFNALKDAARSENRPMIACIRSVLVRRGYTPFDIDYELLTWAAANGRLSLVEELLEQREEEFAPYLPVKHAIRGGSVPILRRFIRLIGDRSLDYGEAMDTAILWAQEEMIRFLHDEHDVPIHFQLFSLAVQMGCAPSLLGYLYTELESEPSVQLLEDVVSRLTEERLPTLRFLLGDDPDYPFLAGFAIDRHRLLCLAAESGQQRLVEYLLASKEWTSAELGQASRNCFHARILILLARGDPAF